MKELVKTKFSEFLDSNKFLLAMSGGVDSCVLFCLMKDIKVDFAVAHANFGLRGVDSQEDEVFVKDLCKRFGVDFYSKSFDVALFKKEHNDSTQSAARKLRYEWFEELMQEKGIDTLVTAHHLDDSIETFFINLLRGTGLRGLTGISSEKIFRPLLDFGKAEILAFAKEDALVWREDVSNQSTDYLRNEIRHDLVPKIQEMKPDFRARFKKTFGLLQADKELLDEYISELKKEIFCLKNDMFLVDIQKLKETKPHILFYLFEPYGFGSPLEIEKMLIAQEGAEIRSKAYRLVKHREHLILAKIPSELTEVYILEDLREVEKPVRLAFRLHYDSPKLNLTLFDYDKIKFPLSLRLSKFGDVFYPKGMHGKSKKLSKFLKDEKLSKIQKENTWLLTDSEDTILWVIGHRLDERFAPCKQTRTWLEIRRLD